MLDPAFRMAGDYNRGDKVFYREHGGWQCGEVQATRGPLIQIVDWRRQQWHWVSESCVRRNLPRQD